MAYLVELTEPRSVGIRSYDDPSPGPAEVLVRTWYSGISAGTELGMYRGTNPYLDRRWDPEMALFLWGGGTLSLPPGGRGDFAGGVGEGGRGGGPPPKTRGRAVGGGGPPPPPRPT